MVCWAFWIRTVNKAIFLPEIWNLAAHNLLFCTMLNRSSQVAITTCIPPSYTWGKLFAVMVTLGQNLEPSKVIIFGDVLFKPNGWIIPILVSIFDTSCQKWQKNSFNAKLLINGEYYFCASIAILAMWPRWIERFCAVPSQFVNLFMQSKTAEAKGRSVFLFRDAAHRCRLLFGFASANSDWRGVDIPSRTFTCTFSSTKVSVELQGV